VGGVELKTHVLMKEFITQKDLDLIQDYAGQEYEESKHLELKDIYEKLDYLCSLIAPQGFKYDIRKDPRKQAGQGMFQFRDYQWARVYPKEYYESCRDKFCYIIGLSDSLHFHMMGYKEFQNLPPSLDASKQSWHEVDIDNSDYPKLVQEFVSFDKRNRNRFIQTAATLGIKGFTEILNNMNNQDLVNLLEYKKQIILQGPPGTGKTHQAKEIAKKLTDSQEDFSIEKILNVVKVGSYIPTITDYNTFEILSKSDIKIQVKPKDAKHDYGIMVSDIMDCIKNGGHNKPVKDNDAKGTGSYKVALAKHIVSELGQQFEFVKLIQFHPAYSYEDFVRGIVAKTTGNMVEYKSENKILGEFAKTALDNYLDSKRDIQDVLKEKWLETMFSNFIDNVEEELEDSGKYTLSKSAHIYQVEEDAFRYTGDNWSTLFRMPFSDIKKLYLLNVNERSEIKMLSEVSGRAKQHATYYFNLLKKFKSFIGNNSFQPDTSTKVPLKKYVLIIDEINRANLPAVLGELIYALEYRYDEKNEKETSVESMYDIDGDRKLALPPNLYIIGTMNTADRSVGHMDYAIRRRFAFKTILPDESVITLLPAKEYFKEVKSLFDKYTASDFEKNDVMLGHSYFLAKDEDELKLKLRYEVLPILREYLKDGVLNKNEESIKAINDFENKIPS
jgi:hypothetical protein